MDMLLKSGGDCVVSMVLGAKAKLRYQGLCKISY